MSSEMQLEFSFTFGNTIDITERELARLSGTFGSFRNGSQYHTVRKFMRGRGLDGIFMQGIDGVKYKWFFNPRSRTGVSRYQVDRLHYYSS